MPKNEIEPMETQLPSTVAVEDAREVFSLVMNFFREAEITKRETARYTAMVEVLTTEINRKYDMWERVFTEVFSERRAGILKTFEIIDKGMEKNDMQMINLGLMGLSNIVASSPFADFDKVFKAINDGKQIYL